MLPQAIVDAINARRPSNASAETGETGEVHLTRSDWGPGVFANPEAPSL